MFGMSKNGQEERCLVGRQAFAAGLVMAAGGVGTLLKLLCDICINIPRDDLYNKWRWPLKGGAERLKYSNNPSDYHAKVSANSVKRS